MDVRYGKAEVASPGWPLETLQDDEGARDDAASAGTTMLHAEMMPCEKKMCFDIVKILGFFEF